MRNLQTLLRAYGEGHRHPVNRRIHDACVPAICFGLVGLLWSAPPLQLPGVTLAPVWLLALVFPYYLVLSARLAWIVLAAMLLMVATVAGLAYLQWPVAAISLVVFVAAWAAQLYGHRIEGNNPSFFTNLLFLLVAPLWVAYKYTMRSQAPVRSPD